MDFAINAASTYFANKAVVNNLVRQRPPVLRDIITRSNHHLDFKLELNRKTPLTLSKMKALRVTTKFQVKSLDNQQNVEILISQAKMCLGKFEEQHFCFVYWFV